MEGFVDVDKSGEESGSDCEEDEMGTSGDNENFQAAFEQLQHSYDVLKEERQSMEEYYQELEDSTMQQEENMTSMRRTISQQAHIIAQLSRTISLLRGDVDDLSMRPHNILADIQTKHNIPPLVGASNVVSVVEKHADHHLGLTEVTTAADADVAELKASLKIIHKKLQTEKERHVATQSQLAANKEEVQELRVLLSSQSTAKETNTKGSSGKCDECGDDIAKVRSTNVELRDKVEELSSALIAVATERDELFDERDRLKELSEESHQRLEAAENRINEMEREREDEEGSLGNEIMQEQTKEKSLSLEEQKRVIKQKDEAVIQREQLRSSLQDKSAMYASACHVLERLYMFTISREKAIIQILKKPIPTKKRKVLLQQLENTPTEKEFDLTSFTSSY
eukprot:m.5189 g.5189  ORF g.5189 m.5189 type:complete len:397 (-) comp4151_c1_seq1:2866-4056(-)